MFKKHTNPSDLGTALSVLLKGYCDEVQDAVDAAGEKAIKKLVRLTKERAPIRLGDFFKSITYIVKHNAITGLKEFTWGVKAPHHRKTHLLVNGYETVNGDRVPGDSFLEDSLAIVIPEYEQEVEEAVGE